MKTDQKLKREVIQLYNDLFNPEIEETENNVSILVMLNIADYYGHGSGSPFLVACEAEEAVSKIKDENKKLLICKQLLIGEIVTIPGMPGTFRLWYIFYDIRTGEKFKNDIRSRREEAIKNIIEKQGGLQ
jgi:hypothetical protein